ncbi:DUF6445 family protein [Massilia sp. B-10]|nr:DUF6445 family protein [Massilia sp. B-10]
MFNPRPTIRYVPLTASHTCAVIDDFLAEPHKLVDYAAAQREQFAMDPDNCYPGQELGLGPAVSAALAQYLALHVRHALGMRRMLKASARLALATLPGQQLSGLQRLCHRDAISLPTGEGVAASVAYLFQDSAMGGTSFYVPRKPGAGNGALPASRCGERPEPGCLSYLTESNDWFEQVCSVPARFNRAIFYEGTVFHAAQIERPDLLAADPAQGRLTMNGFFHYRRNAS